MLSLVLVTFQSGLVGLALPGTACLLAEASHKHLSPFLLPLPVACVTLNKFCKDW